MVWYFTKVSSRVISDGKRAKSPILQFCGGGSRVILHQNAYLDILTSLPPQKIARYSINDCETNILLQVPKGVQG